MPGVQKRIKQFWIVIQSSLYGDVKRIIGIELFVILTVINDMFMVKPMTSLTGYLTYMDWKLSVTKGGVTAGRTAFNGLTGYGTMDADREAYTSERITETSIQGETAAAVALAWGPVVKGAFEYNNTKYDVRLTETASGTVSYANLGSDGKVPSTAFTASKTYKIAYVYDNELVPAENLPQLNGKLESIPLIAHARRIAVHYSQIAAFEAKKDYGLDFESMVTAQAQGELQYEIDSEAVFMIKEAGDAIATDGSDARYVAWHDGEVESISYSQKAEGFARAVATAKAAIYAKTSRFMPSWMVVSPMVTPILAFVPGFKAASVNNVNGPYIAGEIDGLKVIVSPALAGTVCYLGVLNGDTATGVYAPYMPLVPTQLLGFADGGMTQGFSTMYDMRILNPDLVAKIAITADAKLAVDVTEVA